MSGINRLDIKQLRVLQLLLQERNVSRVANVMGLTQQAVSEQLRKLRGMFDDQLFIRTSNGVVPTPLAESLEAQVNQVIQDIEALFSDRTFEPSTLEGVFHITASDYALMTVLPALLDAVNKAAPHLKIIVRDFESDALNKLMLTGEVDLAISFPHFIPETCPSMFLFHEQHVCVVSKHSPLAGQQLSIEALAPHPQLIISPSRANLKGSHDHWFGEKGLRRNVVMSIPSFSAAPSIIGESHLACFLPSRLLPNDHLAKVELDELPPCFDVIAAWHQRSSNSPILKWMLAFMHEMFVEPQALEQTR
ncbi:LysR family transcriptional regulator [Marinomonas gallaica]|uniref:LysR family transcriptional regulator n=1 Tax=Marinomonas gallaica TaxID=1806667 RepID=UPI00082AF637|nr:LysR family transcriptional regulator [Marinomonas gallaica]